ncbi:MAG: alpha amylase C-terminal domain-containing protein [Bacteroidales bacterium]|nr:alpha amylase C-terminal domain-containing protein [Bacteroidales bacterium]
MKDKTLPIVKQDPWLEPVADEVFNRYQRYLNRLAEIENQAGSLSHFANAYTFFGLHDCTKDSAYIYREWAPAAHALFLTGDFNSWNPESHPLTRLENGIWEIILPKEEYKKSLKAGSLFKVIVHSDLGVQFRIPAFAQRVVQNIETRDFAAEYYHSTKFKWAGDKFHFDHKAPLFIYEAHIGMAQEKGEVSTYREFTEFVLPRIKEAGYNTIQLMAIAEHPFYGSFGYHVSNFFAPSSRFGTPDDLKELVKTAHSMGLAVIMDIVHSHAIKNFNEGLNYLDGSDHQYFHPGVRGNHPDWDSKLFDYGKMEVLQFLLSNLKYWMHEFHFDGFRFDGVGSMMYFHHGHDGPFDLNKYFVQGVEFDAITYLQLANKLVHSINPSAITIAEDVTGMPGLTNPVDDGGLGFDYRLGMGIPDFWIKTLKEQPDEYWDVYQFYQTLINRKFDSNTLAYAESHDQALVGDKTLAFRLMDKEMYYHMKKTDHHAVIDRGIALHKMIRFFTIALGGEGYMNFMGNEFGHPEWIDFPREGNHWNFHYARRQWSLVDSPILKYEYLAKWDKAMLKLIGEHGIMKADFPELLNHDDWNKTLVFKRGDLIFVFNWHVNHSIPDYEFNVPEAGEYKLIFNSDCLDFGGYGRINESSRYFSYYYAAANVNRLRIYNVNRAVMVFKKIK